jgi:hypothetical protein
MSRYPTNQELTARRAIHSARSLSPEAGDPPAAIAEARLPLNA